MKIIPSIFSLINFNLLHICKCFTMTKRSSSISKQNSVTAFMSSSNTTSSSDFINNTQESLRRSKRISSSLKQSIQQSSSSKDNDSDTFCDSKNSDDTIIHKKRKPNRNNHDDEFSERDSKNHKSSVNMESRENDINLCSPTTTVTKNKITKETKNVLSPSKSSKTEPNQFTISSSDVSKIAPHNKWIDLNIPPEELRPSATLTTGQVFHWIAVHRDDLIFKQEDQINTKKSMSAWGTHNETEWIGGPINKNIVLSIRETPTTTLCRILYQPSSSENKGKRINKTNAKEEIISIIYDYFQLKTPLKPLYEQWSVHDVRLSRIAQVIPGVRIIRQDPLECLFSFICSSNNNIPRITKMLTSLRQKYGDLLLEIPISTKQEQQTLSIYSFPTLEQLKAATEDELRQLGFGYRAKFIISTRDQLLNLNGEEYLMNLRHGHYLQENYSKQQINIKEENSNHKTDEKKHQKCNNNTYHVVQEELLQFSGIGRKVADCIALFSLDQSNTIPVDVHVQHIASRDYDPTLLTSMNTSTLTPTIYKRVGDLFRERFGTYAGWAHSLLFVAELPSFRDRLPYDIVEQMDKWKEHELEKKVEKKNLKKKNK